VLAKQNEGTLFNGDFAKGYASCGLGATSLTVKKGTIKKYHLDFSLARNTIVVWTIQSHHWAKHLCSGWQALVHL